MIRKILICVFCFFALTAVFFGAGELKKAEAQSTCRVGVDYVRSATGVQIDSWVLDYSMQTGDKVVLITSHPANGQNQERWTYSGSAISFPTPTTDFYLVARVEDSAGNILCQSQQGGYTRVTDTWWGGQAQNPTATNPQSNVSGTAIWTDFGTVDTLGQYISVIWRWLLPVLGTLAFIMIIYAGYMYMTSQGQPEQINKAKDVIIGVVVGIVLLFTIEVIVKNVLGILP